MMSNNKEGMYNIRHPTDQYIQIGDSGLIPVQAIGDIKLVVHQLDEKTQKPGGRCGVCARCYLHSVAWFQYFLDLEGGAQQLLFSNPNWYTSGRLRFIRGSANDSLYATRFPPPMPDWCFA